MSRRIRLAFLLAGLACFAYLVQHVGPRNITADLRRVGWTFAAIVLLWAVVYAVNTSVWLLLLGAQGGRIPFWRAYAMTVSSFAINYVTPFVALGGEPFRAAAAAPWVGAERATGSVVAFRVVHTLGQFGLWLLLLPVAYTIVRPTGRGAELVLVAGAGLVAAVWLLTWLLRSHALGRLPGTLSAVPPLRPFARALERHRAVLEAVDAQLAALATRHPRRLAAALFLETLARFVSTAELALAARSVGAPMGLRGAAFVGGFSQLLMNILFFVPLSVGTKEGGIYLGVRVLGLRPSLGVYAAIVSRLREIAWIALGLALVWAAGARPRAAQGDAAEADAGAV